MHTIANELARQQWPSGQFPTFLINEEEGLRRTVSTLTPTYLVCLFLSLLRERRGSSRQLDTVLERGLTFLEHAAYRDPVEKILVWHFNAYYPPDWEETCWCSFLLFQAGKLSRQDLKPLQRLLEKNSTEQGVGVWVKDPYSKDNALNNVFDPIVSLAVIEWQKRIFQQIDAATESFFLSSIAQQRSSLYYDERFQHLFYALLGHAPALPSFEAPIDGRLFHHGKRTDVWYASPVVWDTAQLLI